MRWCGSWSRGVASTTSITGPVAADGAGGGCKGGQWCSSSWVAACDKSPTVVVGVPSLAANSDLVCWQMGNNISAGSRGSTASR